MLCVTLTKNSFHFFYYHEISVTFLKVREFGTTFIADFLNLKLEIKLRQVENSVLLILKLLVRGDFLSWKQLS